MLANHDEKIIDGVRRSINYLWMPLEKALASDMVAMFIHFINQYKEYDKSSLLFWNEIKGFIQTSYREVTKINLTRQQLIQALNSHFDRNRNTLTRDNFLIEHISAFFSIHRQYFSELSVGLQHRLTIIDPWVKETDDIAMQLLNHVRGKVRYIDCDHSRWKHTDLYLSYESESDSIPTFNPTELIQTCLDALISPSSDKETSLGALRLLRLFKEEMSLAQCVACLDLLFSEITKPTDEYWYGDSDNHKKRDLSFKKARYAALAEFIPLIPAEARAPWLDKFIEKLPIDAYGMAPHLIQLQLLMSDQQCTQVIKNLLAIGHGRLIHPFKRGMTDDLLLEVRKTLEVLEGEIKHNVENKYHVNKYSRFIYLSKLLPEAEQQQERLKTTVAEYKDQLTEESLQQIQSNFHVHGGTCESNDIFDESLYAATNLAVAGNVMSEHTRLSVMSGLLTMLPAEDGKLEIKPELLRLLLVLMTLRDYFPKENINRKDYVCYVKDEDSKESKSIVFGFFENEIKSEIIDIAAKKQSLLELLLRCIHENNRESFQSNDTYNNSWHGGLREEKKFPNYGLMSALSNLNFSDEFIPTQFRVPILTTLIESLKSRETAEHDVAAAVLKTWIDQLSFDELASVFRHILIDRNKTNRLKPDHAMIILYAYHRYQRELKLIVEASAVKSHALGNEIEQQYASESKETFHLMYTSATSIQCLFRQRKAMRALKELKAEKTEVLATLQKQEDCRKEFLAELKPIADALQANDLANANTLFSTLANSKVRQKLNTFASAPPLEAKDKKRYGIP